MKEKYLNKLFGIKVYKNVLKILFLNNTIFYSTIIISIIDMNVKAVIQINKFYAEITI